MGDEKYKFRVLNESVSADDKFQDKTHEKAADALFDLMSLSDQAVTIGLEGGWGSGKSTVVNFLRARLENDDKQTLFFLFDAWAHEGDPLRRIFLESLIEAVDPKGNVDELSKLKQEISGRKKTVSVTTHKSTSKLGGWISLSAILVPVGAAILSAINYEKVLMPWSVGANSMNTTFITGLLLTLAPAWVLSFWRFFGAAQEGKRKTFLAGDKQWDIFAAKSIEDYTQDITEDGERTSIEFERYFKQIMNSSVGEGKKYKQALIVVDNLDRVEPEQTLAIWSILQTFFQHRGSAEAGTKNSWQSKLWFLIPYDREGLSKVWNKTQQLSETADGSVPAYVNKITADVAPSFLDKCFQVVAEVPQPVMSAWVNYSTENIHNSLIGWPKSAVQEVIDTFRRFESSLNSSPSPRQILVFINRVGFLGLRWGNEMSAEAMALYALLRKDRSEQQLRIDLLEDGLPSNYEGTASDNELKSQLAGMLFGVGKTKGMELLLKPVIRSALTSGDAETIQNLVDHHGDGFWVVWQSIKDSNLPNDHNDEYRIAVTQALCGGLAKHKLRAAQSINQLASEWENTAIRWEDETRGDWSLGGHDCSAALQSLIDVAPNGFNSIPWLEQLVKKMLIRTIGSLDTEGFNADVLPNLSKLVTLIEKNGCVLPRADYKELNTGVWGRWQTALSDRNVDFPMVLPAEGTVESLAASFDVNNPTVESISLLLITLSYVPNRDEWELVADKLVAWSSNPSRAIGNDEAYGLMG